MYNYALYGTIEVSRMSRLPFTVSGTTQAPVKAPVKAPPSCSAAYKGNPFTHYRSSSIATTFIDALQEMVEKDIFQSDHAQQCMTILDKSINHKLATETTADIELSSSFKLHSYHNSQSTWVMLLSLPIHNLDKEKLSREFRTHPSTLSVNSGNPADVDITVHCKENLAISISANVTLTTPSPPPLSMTEPAAKYILDVTYKHCLQGVGSYNIADMNVTTIEQSPTFFSLQAYIPAKHQKIVACEQRKKR